MYFIPVGDKFGNNPRHVLEDAYDGLYQLYHNPLLLTAFCGTIISIAFFNFAGNLLKSLIVSFFWSNEFLGISVTKEMSATTRMVLDSVRTLVRFVSFSNMSKIWRHFLAQVIWGVSLGVGWQDFHGLQLLGFVILVSGMCVYNDLVFGNYLQL